MMIRIVIFMKIQLSDFPYQPEQLKFCMFCKKHICKIDPLKCDDFVFENYDYLKKLKKEVKDEEKANAERKEI